MASFVKKYGRRVAALGCALLPLALVIHGVACVADPGDERADERAGVVQQADTPSFPQCPDGGAALLSPPLPYEGYVSGYGGYGYGAGYAPSWYGYGPGGAYGLGELGYGSLELGAYGYNPYAFGSGYLGEGYGGWPGYYGGRGTYGYGLPEGYGYPYGYGYGPAGAVPPGYGVMATADGGVSLCQQ